MKQVSQLVTVLLLVCTMASPLWAAGPAAEESVQSLYLKAGKLERQGEIVQAKEVYETIIDRYPATDFAVKANDRLLVLVKPLPVAAGIAVVKAPLPVDPVKRRGVELAETYKKAVQVREDELARLFDEYTTVWGHKYNRALLAELQDGWDKKADAKVLQTMGMSLEEIQKRMNAACKDAGITGPCTEASFR
jgi:hypothetical protein